MMNADSPSAHYATTIWAMLQASGQLTEEDTAVMYYSLRGMEERLNALGALFNEFQSTHLVAIKTNPHPAILRRIVELGYGLEAASFQEVLLAREAGADPSLISYNSPVKTWAEIARCCTELPGLRLNANNFEELQRLPQEHSLRVGLRINALVDPGSTNALFNVSGVDSKFGVPIDKQEEILLAALTHKVDTLHIHVGSQISAFQRIANAIARVYDLAEAVNARAVSSLGKPLITTINIGGGVPCGTDAEHTVAIMKEYVEALTAKLVGRQRAYHVITEFGQWVHGHNGMAFSRVEYAKHTHDRRLAYVHLGADMFVREVYAGLKPLHFVCLGRDGSLLKHEAEVHDLAGPLCFQGDFLARGVSLPTLNEGDTLVILGTGANTFGLWSRHCSRTIPAFFVDQPNQAGVRKVSDRFQPFAEHRYGA